MLFGIMGAMTEEVALLEQTMEIRETVRRAGRDYHRGRLFGRDGVLVFSHWGKVASASTATTLIDEFGVEAIVFTGVAGAVDPDLAIGDIVVASELAQHDMDARPIFARHEIPYLGVSRFPVRPDWRDAALEAATRFLDTTLTRDIDRDLLDKFRLVSPKARAGLIASGDQLITDSAVTDGLREALPGLQCVEMEGGAVAQVCHEHDIPCLVVRAISDKADHSADIDFSAFLETIASRYACGVLEHLLPRLEEG